MYTLLSQCSINIKKIASIFFLSLSNSCINFLLFSNFVHAKRVSFSRYLFKVLTFYERTIVIIICHYKHCLHFLCISKTSEWSLVVRKHRMKQKHYITLMFQLQSSTERIEEDGSQNVTEIIGFYFKPCFFITKIHLIVSIT